jgi:hypothetical protein
MKSQLATLLEVIIQASTVSYRRPASREKDNQGKVGINLKVRERLGNLFGQGKLTLQQRT